MSELKTNTNRSTAKQLVERTLLSQYEAGNFSLHGDIPSDYKAIVQAIIQAKYNKHIPLTTVARYTNVYQRILRNRNTL